MAARADTSPPVVATHFGASLATFDVEIFLSSSLLAVFCSFWPNIGHSERESPLSANAMAGMMQSPMTAADAKCRLTRYIMFPSERDRQCVCRPIRIAGG